MNDKNKNAIDNKIYRNIEEFYPFYLSQHANNMTRLLHYIGSTGSIVNLVYGFYLMSLQNILLSFIIGYAFAWIGHFFFERNKPATFKYPLMSFICDFIMLSSFIRGKINKDLRRFGIKNIKYLPINFI